MMKKKQIERELESWQAELGYEMLDGKKTHYSIEIRGIIKGLKMALSKPERTEQEVFSNMKVAMAILVILTILIVCIKFTIDLNAVTP